MLVVQYVISDYGMSCLVHIVSVFFNFCFNLSLSLSNVRDIAIFTMNFVYYVSVHQHNLGGILMSFYNAIKFIATSKL